MDDDDIKIGKHTLGDFNKVYISGELVVSKQATTAEWRNAMMLIIVISQQIEAFVSDGGLEIDELTDEFHKFCAYFGAFALTHQGLLNRCAEVIEVNNTSTDNPSDSYPGWLDETDQDYLGSGR